METNKIYYGGQAYDLTPEMERALKDEYSAYVTDLSKKSNSFDAVAYNDSFDKMLRQIKTGKYTIKDYGVDGFGGVFYETTQPEDLSLGFERGDKEPGFLAGRKKKLKFGSKKRMSELEEVLARTVQKEKGRIAAAQAAAATPKTDTLQTSKEEVKLGLFDQWLKEKGKTVPTDAKAKMKEYQTFLLEKAGDEGTPYNKTGKFSDGIYGKNTSAVIDLLGSDYRADFDKTFPGIQMVAATPKGGSSGQYGRRKTPQEIAAEQQAANIKSNFENNTTEAQNYINGLSQAFEGHPFQYNKKSGNIYSLARSEGEKGSNEWYFVIHNPVTGITSRRKVTGGSGTIYKKYLDYLKTQDPEIYKDATLSTSGNEWTSQKQPFKLSSNQILELIRNGRDFYDVLNSVSDPNAIVIKSAVATQKSGGIMKIQAGTESFKFKKFTPVGDQPIQALPSAPVVTNQRTPGAPQMGMRVSGMTQEQFDAQNKNKAASYNPIESLRSIGMGAAADKILGDGTLTTTQKWEAASAILDLASLTINAGTYAAGLYGLGTGAAVGAAGGSVVPVVGNAAGATGGAVAGGLGAYTIAELAGLGTGVAGTLSGSYAQYLRKKEEEEKFGKSDVTNMDILKDTGFGLAMDTIGALPLLGDFATAAKISKTLSKPIAKATLIGLAFGPGIKNGQARAIYNKLMDENSSITDLTTDELLFLGNAVMTGSKWTTGKIAEGKKEFRTKGDDGVYRQSTPEEIAAHQGRNRFQKLLGLEAKEGKGVESYRGIKDINDYGWTDRTARMGADGKLVLGNDVLVSTNPFSLLGRGVVRGSINAANAARLAGAESINLFDEPVNRFLDTVSPIRARTLVTDADGKQVKAVLSDAEGNILYEPRYTKARAAAQEKIEAAKDPDKAAAHAQKQLDVEEAKLKKQQHAEKLKQDAADKKARALNTEEQDKEWMAKVEKEFNEYNSSYDLKSMEIGIKNQKAQLETLQKEPTPDTKKIEELEKQIGKLETDFSQRSTELKRLQDAKTSAKAEIDARRQQQQIDAAKAEQKRKQKEALDARLKGVSDAASSALGKTGKVLGAIAEKTGKAGKFVAEGAMKGAEKFSAAWDKMTKSPIDFDDLDESSVRSYFEKTGNKSVEKLGNKIDSNNQRIKELDSEVQKLLFDLSSSYKTSGEKVIIKNEIKKARELRSKLEKNNERMLTIHTEVEEARSKAASTSPAPSGPAPSPVIPATPSGGFATRVEAMKALKEELKASNAYSSKALKALLQPGYDGKMTVKEIAEKAGADSSKYEGYKKGGVLKGQVGIPALPKPKKYTTSRTFNSTPEGYTIDPNTGQMILDESLTPTQTQFKPVTVEKPIDIFADSPRPTSTMTPAQFQEYKTTQDAIAKKEIERINAQGRQWSTPSKKGERPLTSYTPIDTTEPKVKTPMELAKEGALLEGPKPLPVPSLPGISKEPIYTTPSGQVLAEKRETIPGPKTGGEGDDPNKPKPESLISKITSPKNMSGFMDTMNLAASLIANSAKTYQSKMAPVETTRMYTAPTTTGFTRANAMNQAMLGQQATPRNSDARLNAAVQQANAEAMGKGQADIISKQSDILENTRANNVNMVNQNAMMAAQANSTNLQRAAEDRAARWMFDTQRRTQNQQNIQNFMATKATARRLQEEKDAETEKTIANAQMKRDTSKIQSDIYKEEVAAQEEYKKELELAGNDATKIQAAQSKYKLQQEEFARQRAALDDWSFQSQSSVLRGGVYQPIKTSDIVTTKSVYGTPATGTPAPVTTTPAASAAASSGTTGTPAASAGTPAAGSMLNKFVTDNSIQYNEANKLGIYQRMINETLGLNDAGFADNKFGPKTIAGLKKMSPEFQAEFKTAFPQYAGLFQKGGQFVKKFGGGGLTYEERANLQILNNDAKKNLKNAEIISKFITEILKTSTKDIGSNYRAFINTYNQINK